MATYHCDITRIRLRPTKSGTTPKSTCPSTQMTCAAGHFLRNFIRLTDGKDAAINLAWVRHPGIFLL